MQHASNGYAHVHGILLLWSQTALLSTPCAPTAMAAAAAPHTMICWKPSEVNAALVISALR